MSLSVIGAGFGRTGTHSLKLALEMLGFGPCHHMAEVMAHEEQKQGFRAAGRGERADWDTLYAGYRSAVDWPTAFFWKALAAHYPEAKVILTVRNSEDWFRSASATIFKGMGPDASPDSFGVAVIRNQVFGGNLEDETHVINTLEEHNADVIRTAPAGRLLEYNVADGWPKLCAFLGVPVPAEPFPSSNSTADFRKTVLGRA